MPAAARRLLFSQWEEFPVVHLLLRALFGAASGTGIYLGLIHQLPLTADWRLAAGALFVVLSVPGVCVLAAASSSFCRCAALLMFPSMLGSRGRAYLMMFTLSVLCTGPVANIQANVEAAVLSLSCNLDQQVNHMQLLWRHTIRPVVDVTQALVDDQAAFQAEALNISRKFQDLRHELVLQYGYERFTPKPPAASPAPSPASSSNTQEQFRTKTLMQCDTLVSEGVQRCSDWFSSKWEECTKAVPVPVINHILCVPMKFNFLCDVMRVMTPWCRQQIPVEGNFGRLFDQLNLSVELLSREFSTSLVLEEERQESVPGGGALVGEFTQVLRGSAQKLRNLVEKLLSVLQLLLSFTFISIFIQSFSYLRLYRSDVRFDNIYVTAHFRRIDARRKSAGRCGLLPLRRPEKKKIIDLHSPKIHAEELQQVTSGVLQVLSIFLLSGSLLTVDFALVRVLDIVSRHSFTHYNLTGHHQVSISVGGDSMMARLLRKTVSAFNSSSSINVQTDNLECVSAPSPLPAGVYVMCVCLVLMAALFSCLQVYTNRLRRAIAAFYYPEREKKRILFLYNLMMQRRRTCVDRNRVIRRGHRPRTVFHRLSRWWRQLSAPQRQEVESAVTWYHPG
uniref:DC-STAMP domain containing 1 n=1 Tax=Tetraodon nigroviridis TaxID=99883 RepID=H3CL05_TETNG